MEYTDTEMLDFLQSLTNKGKYTGKVLLKDSKTGRGWIMQETEMPGANSDVRRAISNYMDIVNGESKK